MNTIATTIAELRVLVGYLGEKGQANWWGSEFFGPTATAFLAPIFNRYLFLAQYQGATAAAAKIHDEAIGVGRIYHLFRLPIGLEQASADALNDAKFVQAVQARMTTRELVVARLAELKGEAYSASLRICQEFKVELQRTTWILLCSLHFRQLFFPYVREAERVSRFSAL
jgi:hypothetical protein